MIAKRISPLAYQALRDTLAVVVWNKRPFESLVRTSLRDYPELLAGLNFDDTKRAVADALVDRLVEKEARHQSATLQFMVELASMTRFPNIESIKDPVDRAERLKDPVDRAGRLKDAEAAVAHLAEMTKPYSGLVDEQVQLRAEQDAVRAKEEGRRRFGDDIESLKQRFLMLQASTDPQQRGRDLESLLSELFRLFDMEPRLAYTTQNEQIDGSLRFDTDDYILEAKWWAEAVSREVADAFATKVAFKGKNALGLLVAVNGLSKPALRRYAEKTPFIAMDGADLYLVLDGRIRLDDLIRAKLRHANETGSCFLPAQRFVGSL